MSVKTGDMVYILEEVRPLQRIVGVFSSEHKAVSAIQGTRTFVQVFLIDHDVRTTEWFAHQRGKTYYVTEIPVSS